MSYMPSNPYYAWVYLRIGAFIATPIPPEHLISFERTYAVKDTSNTMKLTLYDDTAVMLDWYLGLTGFGTEEKMPTVELGYGYYNGPATNIYRMTLQSWTSKLNRSGTTTLEISGCSCAMESHSYPGCFAYTDTPIEEIVKQVADENGWIYNIGDTCTIEPIEEVMEQRYEKDPNDPQATPTPKKCQKTFIRMNKSPQEFIQQDLAPYCVTKNSPRVGGYRLWFDDAIVDEEGNIDGSYKSQVVNQVNNYFKGYLTDITDPLTKPIETAQMNIKQATAESLDKVNGIVGQVKDSVNKLNSSLKEIQEKAGKALSGIKGGIGKLDAGALAGGAIGALVGAGINAAGGVVDSAGKTIAKINETGQIIGKSGEILGNLTPDALSNLGTDALNKLTPASKLLENYKNLEQFIGSAVFGKALQNLPQIGQVMFFRPLYVPVGDYKVDPNLIFEIGNTPESTVIEFSYNSNNLEQCFRESLAPDKNLLVTAIDEIDNVPVIVGVNGETIGVTQDDLESGNAGSANIYAISSGTPNALEKIAISLWSQQQFYGAIQATLKIFGDPSIEGTLCTPKDGDMKFTRICQVLVYTKHGQLHWSSGIYFIQGVTDSIQGGSFTTTLNMVKYPSTALKGISGSGNPTATNNTTVVPENASIQGGATNPDSTTGNNVPDNNNNQPSADTDNN